MQRVSRVFAKPLAAVLCIIAAIWGCDKDTTVPFKRPSPAAREARSQNGPDGQATQTTPPNPSGVISGTTARAEQSFRFPVATHEAALPGGILNGGQHTIHAAWLEAKITNSGTVGGANGAVALTTSPDGALALHTAGRTAQGYGALRSPLSLPAPIPRKSAVKCTVLSGILAKPTAGHFIAEASFACSASADAIDSSARLQRTFFVVSALPHLRLLERITLHSAPESAPRSGHAVNLSLEVSGEDLDGDSQPDLRLTLTPQLNKQTLAPIHIQLIDRPGGLTLVGDEPEAALLKQADFALKALNSRPSIALAAATQVSALHGALCRGSGTAQVSLGGRNGMPCPRSVALGRAHAVAVVAHARAGELVDALEAWQAMRNPDVRVERNDESRAEAALASIPRTRHYRFEPGPTLPRAQKPPLSRPPVAFLDEHRLLLRGSPPTSLTLGDTTPTPTSVATPGFLLRSPDGRFVATEVVRTCAGDTLRLFAARQVVMGRSMGKPAMEIPLHPIPHQENCSSLSRPQRVEPGSWTLLRWTSEGLILLDHGKLKHFPLDEHLKGGPAVSPRSGWKPKPSPEPDAISDDSALVPVLTRKGIGLMSLTGQKLELVSTEGLPEPVDSLALSPTAERIVAVVGNRIYVGTRVSPSNSAPPTP